jgi:hypothetical protein
MGDNLTPGVTFRPYVGWNLKPAWSTRGQFFKEIFEPTEKFAPSQHWD